LSLSHNTVVTLIIIGNIEGMVHVVAATRNNDKMPHNDWPFQPITIRLTDPTRSWSSPPLPPVFSRRVGRLAETDSPNSPCPMRHRRPSATARYWSPTQAHPHMESTHQKLCFVPDRTTRSLNLPRAAQQRGSLLASTLDHELGSPSGRSGPARMLAGLCP
jgi:hypothetical protein